jgi:hypothetical protein
MRQIYYYGVLYWGMMYFYYCSFGVAVFA